MVKGRCFCGAVSFEIEGTLAAPSLCHCGQCRRLHGAPGAYTSAPASSYRIAGAETMGWYSTSSRAEQSFCRRCGSKLFWREHGGDELDTTMGSLVGPTGMTLERHIWTRSQGDYYEIGHDGVPRFAEYSRDGQPIGDEPPPDRGPATTAHAGGCQCRAVRYRVSGAMRGVVHCHCSQCRRIHGHASAHSAARTADLALDGGDNLDLVWYRTSAEAQRGFCGACGSSLFWRPDDGATISILAGTLDAPTGLTSIRHIYAADKGDYYAIADAVPQDPGPMSGPPIAF